MEVKEGVVTAFTALQRTVVESEGHGGHLDRVPLP